jgi:tetratricopeptide (TPR) repeat protein
VGQWGRAVWFAGALELWSATARAEGRGQPHEALTERAANADEEARGFFIAGRAAYAAGRYREALERFERSHAMSGRPELLYNIGSAAERAGELGRALEAYRAFVSARPDAERRPEAEARITALAARLASGEPASSARATGKPQVATDPRGGRAPLDVTSDRGSAPESADEGHAPPGVLAPALSLTGAGAVLVGGATLLGLGMAARAHVEDAPDGATYSDYADDFRRAPRLENAGIALLSVGAVAAGLSTWWLVRRRNARVSVAVGPAQIRLRGAF